MTTGEIHRDEVTSTRRRIPDTAHVDRVVSEIRALENKNSMERASAIGALVLERFFDGSSERWQERRKNKDNSLRRIADHPDCPLSRSSLSEAISVCVVLREHPCVRSYGHISASHVAAVASRAADERAQWLLQAEENRWGVAELKERLRGSRRAAGDRRGRPCSAPEDRLVSNARSAVHALRRATRPLVAAELSTAEQESLAGLIREIEGVVSLLRACRVPTLGLMPAGAHGTEAPR